MNKIFTRNIGMFPYSGERKVEGFLKVSERSSIDYWFDKSAGNYQIKNITRGKIYKVTKAIGYGDVEDFVIIDDKGEECKLDSFFFEELTEEEYQNIEKKGPQRKLISNNQK